MSLRGKWEKLPPDVFTGHGLAIREIRDDDDLWKDWQGRGYGESAARLAVRILKTVDEAMPIKLSTEADNKKAQCLYEKIGFQKLDELDGDDLVFCL